MGVNSYSSIPRLKILPAKVPEEHQISVGKLPEETSAFKSFD